MAYPMLVPVVAAITLKIWNTEKMWIKLAEFWTTISTLYKVVNWQQSKMAVYPSIKDFDLLNSLETFSYNSTYQKDERFDIPAILPRSRVPNYLSIFAFISMEFFKRFHLIPWVNSFDKHRRINILRWIRG